MSGLNPQDMEILRQYAQSGNRELYWNYLAQKEGNDGYGLLALGVVRNDNVPGAVANIYAQNRARADGVNMSERQWERFGADLMRADFAERERMMGQGRPDLALNLPVRQVQDVHDRSFRAYGINEDAWTPRMLLDAARRHGGEREAESVWRGMRDNSYLGIGRGIGTSYNAAHRYNDAQFNAAEYLGNVTAARALATQSLPNTDPNRIGASSIYHMYSERDRSWSLVNTAGVAMGGMPVIIPERDPARIAELNDARAVRLHRREMRDDFTTTTRTGRSGAARRRSPRTSMCRPIRASRGVAAMRCINRSSRASCVCRAGTPSRTSG
ncbi:MAG: hypothetical protein E6Q88_01360 [Lysobacteraceae bacterium]|nr:MAG: hypothetical protein E6Q88_01360 [Xanthomonadaceae bacterium]